MRSCNVSRWIKHNKRGIIAVIIQNVLFINMKPQYAFVFVTKNLDFCFRSYGWSDV